MLHVELDDGRLVAIAPRYVAVAVHGLELAEQRRVPLGELLEQLLVEH
jgi:hypothetical protein